MLRILSTALLGLLLTSCNEPAPDPRIAAVEAGLPVIALEGHGGRAFTLQEWMAALDIPGLSLAVIDGGEVVWVRSYGVVEAGGSDAVTPTTRFQAASISKPLSALVLMRRVEAGDLELDAPVNRYLRSWTLRDEAGSAEHGVTLRQLLVHTAGVTPGGFTGYPAGQPLPSQHQILDGEAPAANPPARVLAKPSQAVRYSGLGFQVLQLALTETADQPFETLLEQELVEPLGLTGTGLSPSRSGGATVARGHDVDGAVIVGGWHRYPETAAAGIWSTPSDLARVLIEMSGAFAGETGRLLSPATAREMLTEVAEGEGLSWVLHGDGELSAFSHSGGNAGYRAHIRMLPGSGQGLVLMSNSDNGHLLFSPLLHSVATTYDWPDQPPREVPRHVAVRLLAADGLIDVDVPAELLARYVGRYELEPGFVFDVQLADGSLMVQLGDQPRLRVFPEASDTFYYREVNAQLTFVTDGSGPATKLILRQYGRELEASRVEADDDRG